MIQLHCEWFKDLTSIERSTSPPLCIVKWETSINDRTELLSERSTERAHFMFSIFITPSKLISHLPFLLATLSWYHHYSPRYRHATIIACQFKMANLYKINHQKPLLTNRLPAEPRRTNHSSFCKNTELPATTRWNEFLLLVAPLLTLPDPVGRRTQETRNNSIANRNPSEGSGYETCVLCVWRELHNKYLKSRERIEPSPWAWIRRSLISATWNNEIIERTKNKRLRKTLT